jgi:metallophosphoesterase (TIGR03767 family)
MGVAVIGAIAVFAAAGAAASPSPDTLGQTTLEQRIVPNGDPDFRELALGPGEAPHVLREEGVGTAQPGRGERRTSLTYFGNLSDFQLADEESPARVELIDTGPFSAAIRPWESLNPQIDDAMVRQMNAFAAASPVAAGDGSFAPMDLVLGTGDLADSQQLNETEWVRTLVEGGQINPGSGVDPESGGDALCAALDGLGLVADGDVPQNYTGVQDFDDYVEGAAPQHYDPDDPKGSFAAWPTYPGLFDRAQAAFEAAGLDVPFYVAFGNHDALVQGNAAANALYERVATGCVKPMAPIVTDPGSLQEAYEGAFADIAGLDLSGVLDLLPSDPTKIGIVPPDPRRRFVSKEQYKGVFRAGTQADGYGFDLIDPDEEAASGGAAGYYSWSPKPGLRFISLDSVSEAGVIGPSADGNIDHPQYQWLRGELDLATAADELVVLFSHHAIPSLTASVPDELAPPCTGPDSHGHDANPGCDVDPRDSSPVHLGDDMEALLAGYPHVIAWVAGHSHVNSIEAYPNGPGGFWSIRVAAEADWPQQSRLLELFDNKDGTLSIFGTIIDHASSATAPAAGTDAAGMTEADLASVGRTLSANDPQGGIGTGEGDPDDRNVELLIADPRTPGPDPDVCAPPERAAQRQEVEGTAGDDELSGTAGSDRIRGLEGDDRLSGEGGDDCLKGGRGDDRVKARDGFSETVRCGPGNDIAIVDESDTVKGCNRTIRG